jgi:hypothetical protein
VIAALLCRTWRSTAHEDIRPPLLDSRPPGKGAAQDAAWAADILAAQVTYAAIEAKLRRTDPSELRRNTRLPFELCCLAGSRLSESNR